MTIKDKPARPARLKALAQPARPALADDHGPRLLDEATLVAALARLRAADPQIIDHMLVVGGPPPLHKREAGFAGLAMIVVSQQLSTTSATAIFTRLAAALAPLGPDTIFTATDETLRAVGLSLGKIATLRACAQAVRAGTLPIDALGAMPAEAAHAALVALPGIGPWTADIFLLFCLGHPDAWPAGDLALQEAARLVLNLDRRPATDELHRLADRWRPNRAVAARLLWAYYRVIKQGKSGMVLASP